MVNCMALLWERYMHEKHNKYKVFNLFDRKGGERASSDERNLVFHQTSKTCSSSSMPQIPSDILGITPMNGEQFPVLSQQQGMRPRTKNAWPRPDTGAFFTKTKMHPYLVLQLWSLNCLFSFWTIFSLVFWFEGTTFWFQELEIMNGLRKHVVAEFGPLRSAEK